MNRAGALLAVSIALVIVSGTWATEASYQATTTANPKIVPGDLELLLKPLRKAELIVEVEAWLGLLEGKVRQISLAEIEMRKKGREISETKGVIKAQVKQIQEEDQAKPKEANQPAQAPAAAGETQTKVDQEIREKIENIDKKTEEITQAAETVTETVTETVADTNVAVKEEVRSSEKALVTKTEAVAEAKEKLKETAAAIGESELKLEDKVKKIGEAEIELQTKVKEQLLANINKLREEQTALIDRVRVALAALKAKGGTVTEYEQYVTAISGLKVDVKDISATRAIITGWLKSPEGGLRWGKSIAAFVVILAAAKILAVILSSFVRRALAMNKKCSELLRDFFINLVGKAVMVIGIVVALSMLGINIGPLVAGIGAIGFIVGFALQGTLGNFAAGLMILAHRPYDVGDVVNTAGITGVVQSMNLNTTTIKTFDNQVVVVPNGSIWGDNITNVTGSQTRRIDMIFGISYGDNIAKAQAILEEIVNAHPLVLKDPKPNIRVHELGDSSVNFICRPWAKTSDYWNVRWDITRSVKERFDAEDITIPFPQRDVHVYQQVPQQETFSQA